MADFTPHSWFSSRRRLVSWLAGIVLAALVIMGIWQVAQVINPDLRYATFGLPVGTATGPTSGYGYATDLTSLSSSDLNQRLDEMKATGVTWVRYDLSWADVQPDNAGQYDWSSYDTITKAALAHGFHVLMIIDFAPMWAQAKGCTSGEICAPASAAAYAQFAGAAAQHYGPDGVTDYEIWNEPNIASRFEPGANASLYAQMLKDSYVAIKRIEPNAAVITGGTSPSATDQGDYSPIDFITALYKNGAKGRFDAVAAHPYTYPITPDQSQPTDAWGQLSAVHAIMAFHGDGNMQIWVTEYGAPTNGPGVANDHVTEDVQAQMATQAVTDFRANSWAGPFFWYDYMDDGTTTDTNQNFFGLVRADGSAKPSLSAFESAISGQ